MAGRGYPKNYGRKNSPSRARIERRDRNKSSLIEENVINSWLNG